ncbi:MAG: pyrroloquinoline quinone-dependent dehydrogenase, partial [Verrucomicrobiota bacterium]
MKHLVTPFPVQTPVVPFVRVTLGSLIFLLLSNLAPAADSHRGWHTYSGDATGAKYSSLEQINRANVTKLKPAWIFRSDDMTASPASTIECNPIVVDGIAYLTTPGLKLLALDAATGQQRWVFDPWDGARGGGVNRGVTYW